MMVREHRHLINHAGVAVRLPADRTGRDREFVTGVGPPATKNKHRFAITQSLAEWVERIRMFGPPPSTSPSSRKVEQMHA
jgi:hypothetical protein